MPFGPKQMEQRRFSLSALRSLGMGKSRMEQIIVEEARHLVARFASRKSSAFLPYFDLATSVTNIISVFTFGKRIDSDVGEFLDVLNNINEIQRCAEPFNFLPLLRFVPGSGYRKCRALQTQIDRYFQLRMKDAREGCPEQCFVRMYDSKIKAAKTVKSTEAFHDEENLRAVVTDLFVAGFETTANTLQWALLFMLRHPDVQRRVQVELDQHIDAGRMPSLSDRAELPYTEATLLEIQRIASVAPLAVPHASTKDAVIGGYVIPKGTVILSNIWAIHHDPNLWENPDQFNPERFLDKETNQLRRRNELIPFCIGRRKCIGEQLANAELFLLFTHLMQRFHFRTPKGVAPPTLKTSCLVAHSPLAFEVCAIPRNALQKTA
ncbi:cytochrome P450 2U1-like [Diadema antillarum]|uniref:cytochrome P450 2U1-like n=1 Tax=Diadema antillarum TaxID=105358 RepID=UPI003A8A0B3D